MTITPTNLFALRQLFADGIEDVPNRVRPTSVPHIRRCLAAGLVEVVADGKFLHLTAKGICALCDDGDGGECA